jgi:transposase
MALSAQTERRLRVVEEYLSHAIDIPTAAKTLRLSERQVYRLVASVRRSGAAGLVHGNTGRQPRNKTDEQMWERVLEIVATRYPDSNDREVHEALKRDYQIDVGRESLRKRLRLAGIASKRARGVQRAGEATGNVLNKTATVGKP